MIKKKDTKKRKHHGSNSDFDSEYGIGSGSIGKTVIHLGETCKKTKFAAPSLIKATPKDIISDKKDSNGYDVMMNQPETRRYR